MTTTDAVPTRFMGLDIHKHYLVATAVDRQQTQVYGPKRVELTKLEHWIAETLTPQDAVALEMTTNTWTMVDALEPYVHSVTVVHPPHLSLITHAQVMTDKKASLALAQLHAASMPCGLGATCPGTRSAGVGGTATQDEPSGKSLQNVRSPNGIHRTHTLPPEDLDLYSQAAHAWWLSLPVSTLERFRIGSDLDTLTFARRNSRVLTTVWERWRRKIRAPPCWCNCPASANAPLSLPSWPPSATSAAFQRPSTRRLRWVGHPCPQQWTGAVERAHHQERTQGAALGDGAGGAQCH